MNYSDPSGHGILSKAWKKVKSMAAGISGSVRKGVSQLLGSGKNIRNVFSFSVSKVALSLQSRIFKGASSIGAILGTRISRVSTAYQRAKASGQSTYKWEGARAKEAKNIQLSWTKALLWWFSPIEAGESEEQATAWMAKGGNSVDSETGREYKKKKQVKGKPKDDIPECFRGEKPYKGESGKEAAKRVLEKYGEYDPEETGPGSDFSKLKKYFDTHFK